MLTALLSAVAGAVAALVIVSLHPAWFARPTAFGLAATPPMLRAWALTLALGGLLVLAGAWTAETAGVAGCPAVARLNGTFEHLDTAVRRMTAATGGLTAAFTDAYPRGVAITHTGSEEP